MINTAGVIISVNQMQALHILRETAAARSSTTTLVEKEASTRRSFAAIMAQRREQHDVVATQTLRSDVVTHPSLLVIPRFYRRASEDEGAAEEEAVVTATTTPRAASRSRAASSASASPTTPTAKTQTQTSPLSSALRSSRLVRTRSMTTPLDTTAHWAELDREEERRAINSDMRHLLRTGFLQERSVEILTQRDILEIQQLVEGLCAPLDETRPRGSQGDLDYEMFKQARELFVEWVVNEMVAPRGRSASHGDDDDGEEEEEEEEEGGSAVPITRELATLRAARKAQVAFAPDIFLQFPRDGLGRIESRLFLSFLISYSRYLQARVHLTLRDDSDTLDNDNSTIGSWRKGRLHEDDLEQYIREVISALPSVQDLHEKYPNLLQFYVNTVMRHFLFFETKRAVWLADGSVSPTFSVTELLASDSLRELLSLRYMGAIPGRSGCERSFSTDEGGGDLDHDGDGNGGGGTSFLANTGPMRSVSMGDAGESAAAAIEAGTLGIGPGSSCISSPLTRAEGAGEEGWEGGEGVSNATVTWLMPQNTLSLWAIFHRLDSRKSGLLSKEDLRGYGSGCYTDVFWTRLYQEIETFRGGLDDDEEEEGGAKETPLAHASVSDGTQEMDYKTFVDLLLALEYRHTPQALRFFWPLLDVRKQGYIDAWTIHYFFREVIASPNFSARDTPNPEDVKDEIFDMVKPANPHRITFDDLVRCGVGGAFVGEREGGGCWALALLAHALPPPSLFLLFALQALC